MTDEMPTAANMDEEAGSREEVPPQVVKVLQARVEMLRSNLKDARAELLSSQAQCSDLQASLHSSQEQAASNSRKLEMAKSKGRYLHEKLEQLAAQNRELEQAVAAKHVAPRVTEPPVASAKSEEQEQGPDRPGGDWSDNAAFAPDRPNHDSEVACVQQQLAAVRLELAAAHERLAGMPSLEASSKSQGLQGAQDQQGRLDGHHLQEDSQQQQAQIVKLHSELAAARDHAQQLQTALDASYAESASLQGQVKEALGQVEQLQEQHRAARDQAEADSRALHKRVESLSKALSELEDRRAAVERERDHLIEQVTVLRPVSIANDAMHKELETALRTNTELWQRADQCEALQEAGGRLRDELAAERGKVAQLEDALRVAQDAQQRTAARQQDMRAALLAEHAAFEQQIAGLAAGGIGPKQRASWPPAVVQVVEEAEAGARDAGRAEAAAAGAQLEARLQDMEHAVAQERHQRTQAAEECAQLQANVQALSGELTLQEKVLLEKAATEVAGWRAKLEIASREHAAALQKADNVAAKLRGELASMAAKYEAAIRESEAVKQRAFMLLEERDAQLERAKAQSRQASNDLEGAAPVPVQRRDSQSAASASALEGWDDSLPDDLAWQDGSQGPGVHEAQLQEQIGQLHAALLEEQRTHTLRDKAVAVLKDELAELRRAQKRDDINLDYLKNILVSSFESGELPRTSSLVAVLERLLHFSPAEMSRIQGSRRHPSSSPAKAALFRLPAFTRTR